ncbi:hypothetical protein MMC25_004056 [Agyrium rufum]|nr:hypothetical protein [Agyrium rufum]
MCVDEQEELAIELKTAVIVSHSSRPNDDPEEESDNAGSVRDENNISPLLCLFSSYTVRILVGLQETPFSAHASILEKLSLPDQQNARSEKKKKDLIRTIRLPDDDPEVFAIVLYYLYSEGEFHSSLVSELQEVQNSNLPKAQCHKFGEKIGAILRTADIYRLPDLKSNLCDRLQTAIYRPGWILGFFAMCCKVFAIEESSDLHSPEGPFQQYFASAMDKMKYSLDLNVDTEVYVIIRSQSNLLEAVLRSREKAFHEEVTRRKKSKAASKR